MNRSWSPALSRPTTAHSRYATDSVTTGPFGGSGFIGTSLGEQLYDGLLYRVMVDLIRLRIEADPFAATVEDEQARRSREAELRLPDVLRLIEQQIGEVRLVLGKEQLNVRTYL